MFANRKDGGIQLAAALERYKDSGALVLGIPRGGAETAYYVARHLNAEFSLLISRKLGMPENPEAAFGAIAEDASLYLDPHALQLLSQEEINTSIDVQKREIARRVKKFRNGLPIPEMKDRVVLLVDDGIATGATIFAAIRMCRNSGAKRIVIAAPIAGSDILPLLEENADEVVILEQPEDYFSVSQGYEYFYNLNDSEVQQIMQQWTKERKTQSSKTIK